MARQRDAARMSPDDVFSGRLRPSARELARLIHQINPTGLKLSAREMRRRYGEKTKLQSLFVRSFPDEVEAVVDGTGEGIVLLRHRSSGIDACHALVQQLDDEARSIVQRMLDIGESGPDSEPMQSGLRSQGSESGSVGALIEAGRKAAATYDFELARSRLAQAVELSGGSGASGAAMLDLLVEQLGLFQEALELEAQLSAEALEHGSVRALLGKAAAYCGERERALSLIQSCRNARTAEVHALLARQAIDAGQLDVATADCRTCAEHDPACPALVELRESLDRLDAEERTAARARVEALAETEDLHQLQKAVGELLGRWPGDPIGTRLDAVVNERRALVLMQEHALRADALAEARDWEGALAAIRRAIACAPSGRNPEDCAYKIATWEARQQEARDQSQFERAYEVLRSGPMEAGITTYLESREPVRSRLRTELSLAELDLADTLVARYPNAKPKEVAVAITALVRAESLVKRDPETAIRLIERHARLLLATDPGRRVRDRAGEYLERARWQAAAANLERTRVAFADGDLTGALGLLSRDAVRAMPEDLRGPASALLGQLEAAEERQRNVARLAGLSREPVPLQALELLDALLADPQCVSPAALLDQREDLLRRIREAFYLRADTSPAPMGPLPELAIRAPTTAWRILLDDGRRIVIASCGCDRLFIRKIDLFGETVDARVTLRMPERFELLAGSLFGNRLLLVGLDGAWIELSLETWDILALKQLPFPAPQRRQTAREAEVEQLFGSVERTGFFGPQRDVLWVVDREGHRVSAYEPSRYAPLREISNQVDLLADPLPDLDAPCVCVSAVSCEDGLATLSAFDGRGRKRPAPEARIRPHTLWAHPDRQSIVYLVDDASKPSEGRDEATPSTRWEAWSPSGGRRPLHGVDVPGMEPLVFAVRDDATELTWLVLDDRKRDRKVLGVRGLDDGGVEVVHRVDLPQRAALLQSSSGSVLTLVNGPGGLSSMRMAGAPAVLQSIEEPVAPRYYPTFGMMMECHRAFAPPDDAAGQFLIWMEVRKHRVSEVEERIETAVYGGNPDEALVAIDAVDRLGIMDLVGGLIGQAFERYPDHPGVRLAYARGVSALGKWTDLVDLLAPVDPDAIAPNFRRHLFHLLGAAYLQLGEVQKARSVLEQGESCEGKCDLEWLLAMAIPLGEAGDRVWSPDGAALRGLMESIARADEDLDRGHPAQALARLDTWDVWQMAEVQSFARMAEACVRLEPEEAALDPFRAALTVARFCEMHAGRTMMTRRELAMAGRWDMERLDALDRRARQWLAERLGG